jgi:hypothetical protein
VAVSLKALHKIGFSIVKPDQLTRLTAAKTGTAASTTRTTEGIKRFPD